MSLDGIEKVWCWTTVKNNGFNVELFFSGDIDVSLQQRQIKRLSDDSNIDALVIGSIDGNALKEALSVAKSKNYRL